MANFKVVVRRGDTINKTTNAEFVLIKTATATADLRNGGNYIISSAVSQLYHYYY